MAGVKLIYHTAGHEKLSRVSTQLTGSAVGSLTYFLIDCVSSFQLDTVCRILRDRKWSVGRLARCTLISNQYFLDNPGQFIIEGTDDKDFFDRLLGIDRCK